MRLSATFPIVVLLLASGCAGPGSNAKWWSPATWFSGSEARKVETLNVQLGEATVRAQKEAQRAAHETRIALETAPPSRPVELARESNGAAVAVLDQLAGSLTYSELESLRTQVTRLLSENEALRKQGENERAVRRSEIESATTSIADLNDRLGKANATLKDAFTRENALANQLRNERLVRWALIGLAVLIGCLWLYAQLALGGIPAAMGRGLSMLRMSNPEAGELATQIFDGLTNRGEQRRISRNA